MDELTLLRPTMEWAEQIIAYRAEMLANGDALDGCAGLEDVSDAGEWLDFDRRLQAKYGEDCAPSKVFLGVRTSDGKLVGILDYRRPLTPPLRRVGGNIGYSVRPSERRKGYAAQMLALALEVCRAGGEQRVLLTCDRDNEVSRRTILANGGVLEDEIAGVGDPARPVIQRYWIELT